MQRMKKNWKKIAISLSVFLLAIAGYLVYTFEVKDYDTADEEVDEITKDEIEVDLPDNTTITVDQEGNVTTGESENAATEEKAEGTSEEASADAGSATSSNGGTTSSATAAEKSAGSATPATASSSNGSSSNGTSSTGTSSDGSSNNGSSDGGDSATKGTSGSNGSNGSGSSTGNTGGSTGNTGSNGSGNDSGSNRVTVSQIKEKYEPSLVGLENTANERINALVSRAKAEYLSDDSVNYARYYNKYTTAAEELEKRADTAFYAVVAVMKSDLKANGLAESHTKSVVDEYESTKKQRKSALMKQAAGFR